MTIPLQGTPVSSGPWTCPRASSGTWSATSCSRIRKSSRETPGWRWAGSWPQSPSRGCWPCSSWGRLPGLRKRVKTMWACWRPSGTRSPCSPRPTCSCSPSRCSLRASTSRCGPGFTPGALDGQKGETFIKKGPLSLESFYEFKGISLLIFPYSAFSPLDLGQTGSPWPLWVRFSWQLGRWWGESCSECLPQSSPSGGAGPSWYWGACSASWPTPSCSSTSPWRLMTMTRRMRLGLLSQTKLWRSPPVLFWASPTRVSTHR